MTKRDLTQTLRKVQFLNGIDPVHLDQIVEIAEICDCGADEILFCEGEPAKDVYLVVSGKLSLELSPATIYSKHLVSVGPGEMLGWSAFAEQPQFSATAVVTEPARLVRIDGERLRAICEADREFGYEFMHRTMLAVAQRLTATWAQLSHLYVSHYLPVTAPVDE